MTTKRIAVHLCSCGFSGDLLFPCRIETEASQIRDISDLLREAKEKHAPVLITNADESRALYLEDANSLRVRISIDDKTLIEF